MYELYLKKSYHQIFELMYKSMQNYIPKVKPQTCSENCNILRSVFLCIKAQSFISTAKARLLVLSFQEWQREIKKCPYQKPLSSLPESFKYHNSSCPSNVNIRFQCEVVPAWSIITTTAYLDKSPFIIHSLKMCSKMLICFFIYLLYCFYCSGIWTSGTDCVLVLVKTRKNLWLPVTVGCIYTLNCVAFSIHLFGLGKLGRNQVEI